MTSQPRQLFWGLFFITLGVLFLARNWGLFALPDWKYVRGLWPVLLILGGVALMLRRYEAERGGGSVVSMAALAALAVAVPFWLFSFISRDRYWQHDRNDNYSFRSDPPNAPGAPDSPDFDDDDEEDKRSQTSIVGTFAEDMPAPAPASAKFVLEGGAAAFRMTDGTTRLIDARSEAINPYTMSIDRGATPLIRFEPAKNGNGNGINIDLSDRDNVNFGEVNVKLNEAPLWDMEMDFGAGSADFDLRRYALRSLDIEAGAASLDLRLGDKAAQTDVKISSGMASVKIRVPKGAGVKLITDGGLNATDIDRDFERSGNNTYLSPNFGSATKKITIHYDGGLSHFEIDRE
jgi:Domain of unknown function (DUF5668)